MPRCKNCKEKFEPKTFLQKYCFKDECIRVFVEKTREKTWKKTKAKVKQDLMTLSDYLRLTQQIFNKYIRLKARGGYCCSCGSELKNKFDAGHYMNANNHWAVRFDERNVWAQCVNCNQHKHGNLIEYRRFLVKHHGEEWVQKLEQDARVTRKFTKDELKEIMAIYKKKCKELEIYQKE